MSGGVISRDGTPSSSSCGPQQMANTPPERSKTSIDTAALLEDKYGGMYPK